MRFIKKTTWTVIGNIIFGLSQWIIIVLLTKSQGLDIVGVYGFSIAFSTTILNLTNLGMNQIYLTNEYQREYKNFLLIRFFTSIIFILICIFFIYFKDYPILYMIIFLSTAFWKVIDSEFELIYSNLQKEFKLERIAISKVIKSVINVVFFYIVLSNYGLTIAFIGTSIVLMLFYMLEYYLLLVREGILAETKKITLDSVFKIVALGIPLGFSHMFSSLNTTLPNLFLESYSTLKQVGIYSTLMIFNSAISIIVFSLNQILLVKLVEYKKNNNLYLIEKVFKITLLLNFLIGLIVILFVAIFGSSLLTFVFSDEFSELQSSTILFLFSALFMLAASLFLNSFLLTFNLYKSILTIQLVSMILNVVFCIVFKSMLDANIAIIIFLSVNIIEFFIKFIYIVRVMKKQTTKRDGK